jgi:hypothetical protein
MYWDTLIVLGIYISLQLILGILCLFFTDQSGSRKTDVVIRGGHGGFPNTISGVVKQGQEPKRLPVLMVV